MTGSIYSDTRVTVVYQQDFGRVGLMFIGHIHMSGYVLKEKEFRERFKDNNW